MGSLDPQNILKLEPPQADEAGLEEPGFSLWDAGFEALGGCSMNNLSRKLIFKMLNSPRNFAQVDTKALW